MCNCIVAKYIFTANSPPMYICLPHYAPLGMTRTAEKLNLAKIATELAECIAVRGRMKLKRQRRPQRVRKVSQQIPIVQLCAKFALVLVLKYRYVSYIQGLPLGFGNPSVALWLLMLYIFRTL